MPQIQLTKNSSGASITRDAAQVKASIERAFYELGESYIVDQLIVMLHIFLLMILI
jgi:hypothetical protein